MKQTNAYLKIVYIVFNGLRVDQQDVHVIYY